MQVNNISEAYNGLLCLRLLIQEKPAHYLLVGIKPDIISLFESDDDYYIYLLSNFGVVNKKHDEINSDAVVNDPNICFKEVKGDFFSTENLDDILYDYNMQLLNVNPRYYLRIADFMDEYNENPVLVDPEHFRSQQKKHLEELFTNLDGILPYYSSNRERNKFPPDHTRFITLSIVESGLEVEEVYELLKKHTVANNSLTNRTLNDLISCHRNPQTGEFNMLHSPPYYNGLSQFERAFIQQLITCYYFKERKIIP